MVIKYLIEKEFKQMMRNIILPVIFVLLPIGVLNLIPRVATQEVKNLNVSVIDNDHSTLSKRLEQKICASGYFHLYDEAGTSRQAMEDIDRGESDFIIEIEPDFERNLIREGESRVMITGNAVNGVKAGLGSSYLAQIIADFSAELRREEGLDVGGVSVPGFDVSPRYLYNTTLDYKTYMVPGLLAMLLVLTVGFLPALNIVGEKEKGTIEQINVTPVRRRDFILSKMIPYWVVGLFMMLLAMLVARGLYGIVPVGSVWTILIFSTIFILLMSSLGLIISNYSGTMQQAALVMFFFLVIFLLMSGLLTPISSMPAWAQKVTLINPLRYFIEVLRSVYLKGSELRDLMSQFYALIAITMVVGIWAIASYRKQG
ncbi:MAG: ABC transporter permease [Lepagella sp.]